MLSFFGLCEEAQCVYLRLHLGGKCIGNFLKRKFCFSTIFFYLYSYQYIRSNLFSFQSLTNIKYYFLFLFNRCKIMANRHMKKCSMSLNYQKDTNWNYSEASPHTYQNGYHQLINKKFWRGCGEQGTLVHALLVGMQTGADTVKNSMELPEKIKSGTALWSSGSTSGNVP